MSATVAQQEAGTLVIPHLDGEYTDIARARTYYSDYRAPGDIPTSPHTVVGLNGLAGACDSFWPLLAELPDGWRWLLPDLPGGGKSGLLPVQHDLPGYVAWLDELITRFVPDTPHLTSPPMGQEEGGVVLQTIATGAAIALEYALLFPHKVRAMILHLPVFDGSAFNPTVRKLVSTIVTSKLGQQLLDRQRHDNEFMHKIIAHQPPEAIPEMAERDIEHKQQANLPAVGQFLAAIMGNRALPKLAQVNVPMLFLATAHDFSAPRPLIEQIAAQRPNRILYVHEAGHAWNEEFIHVMNAKSRAFLESLP